MNFSIVISPRSVLSLQVVDMRWGVRDEMTNEHMTTDLCMTELENCQRLSMGPNFIYFGAQKYGYRPIPTYIVSSELALLREVLVSCADHIYSASIKDWESILFTRHVTRHVTRRNREAKVTVYK